jgi:hypothetical protein
MKPTSDLFDGLVVFISPGATLQDPKIGEFIVKLGGLVVTNVNKRACVNFRSANTCVSDPFLMAMAPTIIFACHCKKVWRQNNQALLTVFYFR